MAHSSSQELAGALRAQRLSPDTGYGSELSERPPQTPEDVVRTLMLVAPDSGKPPPEIIGAALKAAGIPVTDQALSKALQEAYGPGAKKLPPEIAARARAAAGQYAYEPSSKSKKPEPSDAGYVGHTTIKEPKGNGSAPTAITFTNGLALMSDKPAKANRVLEAMRAGMRVSPFNEPESLSEEPEVHQKLDLNAVGGMLLPQTPEDVARTLMRLIPDAGSPPPEVIGAAMKASGVAATEENLQKALREAMGRDPRPDELLTAQAASQEYKGAKHMAEAFGEEQGGAKSSSSKMPRSAQKPKVSATNERAPEEIIQVLCSAAPDLGQPPATVVGMALRQAGLRVTEEKIKKALTAAGYGSDPSSKDIKTAMAAGQDLE